MMSKAMVKGIQEAYAALVKAHPEWNVRVTKNNAILDTNEIRLTFVLTGTTEGGEREDFARTCGLFGLKPEAYGTVIHTSRGTGILVGFNLRRPKFPVRVRVGGEDILYTDGVLRSVPAELRTREPIPVEDL